jgi:ribosomal protein L32E
VTESDWKSRKIRRHFKESRPAEARSARWPEPSPTRVTTPSGYESWTYLITSEKVYLALQQKKQSGV